MSFTQNTLAKTSSGFAHIVSGGNWTYTSIDDDFATIEADGYFDAVGQLFRVGEVLQIKDSTNNVELLEVSVINPTAPRVETKKFVGSGSIADGSVTTEKLADLAVTTIKIGSDAVTSNQLSVNAVTSAKLSSGIFYNYRIVAVAVKTTVGGGTTESFTVAGALSGDEVIAIVKTGATAAVFRAEVTGANTVQIRFNVDPSTTHTVLVTILRAIT